MSDIRDEFERTVRATWSDSYSFMRGTDDHYFDDDLDGMWWAWQASCPEIPHSSDPIADAGKMVVIGDLIAERRRQDEKWGGSEHDDRHPPEFWTQLIQDYTGWARVMAGMDSPEKYRKRMVQVAALAVSAVETLDRAGGDNE